MYSSKMRLGARRTRPQIERLEFRRLLVGDLVGHWLAHDLLDVAVDGETPSVWTDRVSGATAEPNGQPVFAATAAGGRAALSFDPTDGLDRFMIDATQSPVAGADDFSVVAVFATDATSHPTGANWLDQAGIVDANALGFGNDWGTSIDGNGAIAAGISGGFASPARTVKTAGGFNDGQLHTLAFTRSGSEITISVDDEPSVSRNDGSAARRDLLDVSVGALLAEGALGASAGFDGLISEVRFYNGALDAGELSVVRAEIETFYNNVAPVAAPDTFATTEDTLLFVSGINGVLTNDSDADGDPLTAELIAGPSRGTLGLNPDGGFIYTPDANFNGTDSFQYAARDFRNSEPVTVTIDIAPAYDPVETVADAYEIQPTETLNLFGLVGLLANDINVDRNPLTAELANDVTFGTLDLRADGGFTYDPQGNSGIATFAYQVNDGISVSAPQEVTIIVNTPPTGMDDEFSTAEDTPLSTNALTGVTANDVDPDGDVLTVDLIDDVQNGVLNLASDGSFTYTPNPNFHGQDTFTYRIADDRETEGPFTATITVTPVNDRPVAIPDSYFGAVDSAISVPLDRGVLTNDVDIEDDSLTATVVNQPSSGQLAFSADGSFTYTPNPGFVGTDSFSYLANDGLVNSETGSVELFIGSSPLLISEVLAANVTSLETRTREMPDDNFRGSDDNPRLD